MAAFEPFFFHTQGYGVIYLAFQHAGGDDFTGETYIATGAFQNINQTGDGKYIYHLDGRYTDQMNDASVFGKTLVSDTTVHTKAKMKKFIKDQGLEIDPDGLTLYSFVDFYWFVTDGLVSAPKPARKSASKAKSKKST
jgi:hypothetical protein